MSDSKLTPGGYPYRQHPHPLCGSNSDRQSVGEPGHCEDCCSVGHLVAHPDLGCGDVGCDHDHYDRPPAPAPKMHVELTPAERRQLAATLIRAAGDLIDTPETPTMLPRGMDRDAAARQLGRWLAKLPGAAANWDELLTWPDGTPR